MVLLWREKGRRGRKEEGREEGWEGEREGEEEGVDVVHHVAS